MAYSRNTYMPYTQQTPQQPASIVSISSIEEANSYPVMPGMSSPPLFLNDDNVFLVKMVDQGGAVSIKHYRFEDVTPDPMAAYVTRDEMQAFIDEIKEAINGKRTSTEPKEQSPAVDDATVAAAPIEVVDANLVVSRIA